jgi:fatty-acyl-CoA synthase
MTLWGKLLEPPGRAALEVWAGGSFRSSQWHERVSAAGHVAADLRDRFGVTRGVPVGCIVGNSVEAVDAVLGVWLAGGIVLSLPARARGLSAEEHARQVRALLEHADAQLFLASEQQLTEIAENVPVASSDFGGLGASRRLEPDPPGDGDVCFVQFSSGATADPKGCTLTPAAISRQLSALGEALALSSRDRFASWLPLSHDMGFFGTFMLPWWHGLDTLVSTPSRFVSSPRSWLDDCARFGATITAAPNFALDVAARAARKHAPSRRLSLRALVVGAEPIRWQSLVAVDAVLARHGLPLDRLTPAYGLAEATLAVTMAGVDAPPQSVSVHGGALRSHELQLVADGDPDAERCVALGTPVHGASVRIEGGDVGEVLVESSSVADGYFRAPELTAERFVDGIVRTGDTGFIRNGELHVVGRADDVLVVRGRNVWARAVEVAIEERLGLSPGRAAVVTVGGSKTPRLVALVEYSPDAARAVATEIDATAVSRSGVGIDECLFLAPRAMPRSASGKLQRTRARAIAARELDSEFLSVALRRG